MSKLRSMEHFQGDAHRHVIARQHFGQPVQPQPFGYWQKPTCKIKRHSLARRPTHRHARQRAEQSSRRRTCCRQHSSAWRRAWHRQEYAHIANRTQYSRQDNIICQRRGERPSAQDASRTTLGWQYVCVVRCQQHQYSV